MQRVMIIGQPGSGKSTLARAMGAATGLPVFHMDQIHWQSGWIERSQEEKLRLAHAVHSHDRWIFEGGHSRSWHERLARADTLIWLDFGISLRLWRVFKRTIRDYGRNRPDLPEGCPEQISPEFYRWIWDTRHSGRAKMRDLFETAPQDKTRVHLTSRAQVDRYVSQLT